MFNLFERRKGYTDLHGADFEKALKENRDAVLVDVRTKGEFQSGRIPGAIHIDLMSADFAARVAGLDKRKTYLVYCRSGSRSAQACNLMASGGLNTCNLSGGITNWPGKVVSR